MVATLETWPEGATDQAATVGRAAELLRQGGLLVFPTDTVYGLGANPTDEGAILRIYQVKGRPDEKAIVWLVDALTAIEPICHVSDTARRLATSFWPGPLTLILEKHDVAGPGLPTLGVRVPAHPAALAIITAAGGAVATTSANRSGEPSARTAQEAAAALGKDVDLIIDGGPAPVGIESTVLDVSSARPRLLRQGALSAERIALALGIAAATLQSG